MITAAKEVDGVLLGPVSHNVYPPVSEGGLNPSGVLRRELELYRKYSSGVVVRGVTKPNLKTYRSGHIS